jgi:hypothetical protein
MKYEDFWNATLAESLASVDGYLKRQEDYLRGVRKMAWHAILPYLDKKDRSSGEFELFWINGDPTAEEIEEMKKKQLEAYIKEMAAMREKVAEEERKAGEHLSDKV